MKPEYTPRNLIDTLGKLVEECGEVSAAAGKTLRFGLEGVNPELPPGQQETNRLWLLRKLCELREALKLAQAEIEEARCPKCNIWTDAADIKRLDNLVELRCGHLVAQEGVCEITEHHHRHR